MYLLLGAPEFSGNHPTRQQPNGFYDSGDRVSASSSGIASASWPEDQELSGSSCECDRPRRSSSGRRANLSHQRRPCKRHSPVSPSIEHASTCATETTDCPSEASVIHGHGHGARGHVNAGVTLSCEDLDRIQVAPQAAQPQVPGTVPGSHFTPVQLRMLVRDRLIREGIRLSKHPYTSTVRKKEREKKEGEESTTM